MTGNETETTVAPPRGIVTFYNGACPVCRTEVGHYRGIDARHGLDLGWCDISREPDVAAALGVDGEALKRRLHAVDEDGGLHVGLDAFILLWSRLPRFRWLSRLVAFPPPVHAVAGWFYEHILAALLYAMNRRRERHGARD